MSYDQQRQYGYQPRRRARRRSRNGLAFLGCGGLGAVAILVALLAHGGGGSPSAGAAAGTTSSAAVQDEATVSASESAAAARCSARKAASGDILVRTVVPGLQAQAQELGGGYAWDYVTGKCLNSVDFTIASAANGPGDCTTVGYVKDNPGYDATAIPAAPIPNVVNVAGPGC